MIEARFGLPTHVIMISNVRLSGIAHTADQGADDVVLLSFGCGVGGAVIQGTLSTRLHQLRRRDRTYHRGLYRRPACSCLWTACGGCAAAHGPAVKDQIIQQAANPVRESPALKTGHGCMGAMPQGSIGKPLDRISTYMAITVSNAACFSIHAHDTGRKADERISFASCLIWCWKNTVL